MVDIHEKVEKDIRGYKGRKIYGTLSRILSKFERVGCDHCGKCCKTSPDGVTYLEFIHTYSYIVSNITPEMQVELLKNLVTSYLYELIEVNQCSFRDKATGFCLVNDAMSFSCKTGVLLSEFVVTKVNQYSLNAREELKMRYAKDGVVVPEDVLGLKLDYCSKVHNSFVKSSPDASELDLSRLLLFISRKSDEYFPGCSFEDDTLAFYFSMYILGVDVDCIRLKLTKDYQGGNITAIDDYVNKIDFDFFCIRKSE